MPNEIPHSDALSEASPESLQDLFSRIGSPEWAAQIEPLRHRDLCAVVAEIRAQRERVQAAQQSGTRVRQTRIVQPPVPAKLSDLLRE